MNLAELTAVIVAISGFITPAIVALGKGASWWIVLACGIGGIVYGVALGLVAGKIAFWLLDRPDRNRIVTAITFGALMLFPIPAIGISIVGALGLTSLVLK
jgi:hypothetical protein